MAGRARKGGAVATDGLPVRSSPRAKKASSEPRQQKRRVVKNESSDESSLSSELSDSDLETSKPRKKAKGKQSAKPASRTSKKASTKNGISKAGDEDLNTQALDHTIETPDLDEKPAQEPQGTKRKRTVKTKAEKEAEAMPLAGRTPAVKMFVGAHTSIAKGVENSITNAVHIGGNSFACFLKSQRKWDNPSLQDANRDAFKQHLITHKYDASQHIVPHGSYLVNLATQDPELAQKSYNAFIDDLRRCEALGIGHYNFHPGAAGKAPMPEAIGRLAANLNRALSETNTVVPLLENMATRGSIIGGRFSDLRDVIALIKPEYKSRIGVCIDTCHAFASGYDLRSPGAFKATLEEFDKTVGISYLKALHLNDSKAPFSSNRDLHQNIGLGFLGLRAFHNVMNEPRFEGLPLILETPCDRPDPKDQTGKKTIDDKNVWAKEIKLLESLIGMDTEGAEFKKLEKELSDEGKSERAKQQKLYDEKNRKAENKLAKERAKGQKSVKDMFGKSGQKRSASTLSARDGEDSSLSELDDEDLDQDDEQDRSAFADYVHAEHDAPASRDAPQQINKDTIASVTATHPKPGPASHAASEGAVAAFTHALATEAGSSGATADIVTPGLVFTNTT